MAKFFVGQRVRIRWSDAWPELAGAVGTIVSASNMVNPHTGYQGDWEVSPDAWWSSMSPDQSGIFVPCEEQLEPATDENDKISWDQCIWAPEHMRETV